MKLYLYKTQDAENVINKILTDQLEIDITLKRDVNISNPQLVLKVINGVDFSDYNYALIPDLKRSYFINQITNLNALLWQFDLECDVLETYKADILNSNARFRRNIKHGDYLNTNIDHSIFSNVTKYNSDVTLTDDKNLIMVTVGV